MAEYHVPDSCNKCGADNEVKEVDFCDGFMSEAETTCKVCSHKDYWAFGFFESGAEMKSNCKKYYRGK